MRRRDLTGLHDRWALRCGKRGCQQTSKQDEAREAGQKIKLEIGPPIGGTYILLYIVRSST